MPVHERHWEWIEARGLDPELAVKFGLQTVTDRDGHWLAIPYFEAGNCVNHKYRLTSEKRHRMDSGAPLSLWNMDVLNEPKVRSGQAPVVICEGEWDAMAAIQSGLLYAVSVPNGAPAQETEDLATAKRYEWVDRHADALAGVREFVIATDGDQPGYNLAADLVGLLGAARCRFVEYPEGCKDLNEVLVQYGPEKVVDCVTTARPYPVQGLYTMDDFPERGEVRAYSIGIPAIEDYIQVVPGTLTVLTGFANAGKSTLLDAIVSHCMAYHFPVCVASFETDVKPILRDGLRMTLMRCGKHDLRTMDLTEVDELIRNRLTIISQAVDEDMEMDIEKFLDLCGLAVRRHGTKAFFLDPWNEVEHKRRQGESETDYIGRAIRAVKRFAKQYDVAMWIAAHPSKPMEGSKGPPGLYQISGSANWANKADYGLTYHRPKADENRAQIIITKVRKGLPGKRGKVHVMFDFRDSTFKEIAGAELQEV